MAMTCGTARRVLWAEPAPRPVTPDTRAAESHVRGCAACQAFFHDHRALAAILQRHAPREPAPPHVRGRVFDTLGRAGAQTAPGPGLARRFGGAAAVAVVVIGASLGIWLVGGTSADEQWRHRLSAFAGDHLEAGTDLAIASSNRIEIRAWLDERLGFAVHVPRIPNAEVEGARLCAFAGRSAGVVCYRIDGQMVSLYLMAADPADPSRLGPAQLVSGGDGVAEVVVWEGGGLVHALAGRVTPARLRDMARSCLDVPAGRRRF